MTDESPVMGVEEQPLSLFQTFTFRADVQSFLRLVGKNTILENEKCIWTYVSTWNIKEALFQRNINRKKVWTVSRLEGSMPIIISKEDFLRR